MSHGVRLTLDMLPHTTHYVHVNIKVQSGFLSLVRLGLLSLGEFGVARSYRVMFVRQGHFRLTRHSAMLLKILLFGMDPCHINQSHIECLLKLLV